MKKLKKFHVKRTHYDSPTPGCHIDSMQLLAFAWGEADLTGRENAHFDVCKACRLKLVDALKEVSRRGVRTITPKAA